MKIVAHIVTVVALFAAFFALPFALWGNPAAVQARVTGAGVDPLSPASVVEPAPEGSYTILVNRALHPDAQALDGWVAFFAGQQDAPPIRGDVSAVVLSDDSAGLKMAKSLQSRLAANQMTLRTEVAPIVLSQVERGDYDVFIASDEALERWGATGLAKLTDAAVIRR
jgi:hypothetical protein